MKDSGRVNVIFTEPAQWGLRGDPFLWSELRNYFATHGVPATSGEFTRELATKIKTMTQSELEGDEPVFVERFASGGMSSGHVSPEWWRATGLPLLKSQFEESRNSSDRN